MRTTVLFLICLCLACSKKPAPELAEVDERAEAEPELEPVEAPAAPPEVLPTTRLTTSGTAPFRAMRWAFRKGAKEAVKFRAALKTKMPNGESARPPVEYTLGLQVVEVGDDETALVSFRITDVAVEEVPGFDASMLEALESSVRALRGKTGTYRISSRGLVDSVQLDNKTRSDEGIERLLGKLIHWTTILVPEEDVGNGAKWTNTRTYEDAGIRMHESIDFSLTKLRGSKVDVEGRVTLDSPRQRITKGPGVPPGGSITMLGIEGDGTISGSWELGKLAPATTRIQTTETKRFLGPGTGGDETTIELVFETDLTIRRKK